MLEIRNNIVYLTRGDDGVYARSIRRNDKYKSPYVISNGLIKPKIRMTIKSNKNDVNPILEYEGDVGIMVPTFDTQAIEDITDYPTNPENKVYRITLRDNYNRPTYEYHYYRTTPDIVGVADDTKTPYSADWLKTIKGATIVPEENVLYTVNSTLYAWDGEKYYEVTGLWETYDLILKVVISADDTKNLVAGTYYYDIALITRENGVGDIEYSDTWLTPTEFIIGGSLSE